MPSRKYRFPGFLAEQCSEEAYLRWLGRKAAAHRRRDSRRSTVDPSGPSQEAYKVAIHAAVVKSDGRDFYTGKALRWDLISTFANVAASEGKREYKRGLSDLPTLDHLGGPGELEFVICSWRTNDCKNDLSGDEFIEFCRSVLRHHDARGTSAG